MESLIARTKRLSSIFSIDARHALGQNFIVDEKIIKKIIDANEILKSEYILEIGPGLGTLTGALLDTGAEVIAVELDRRLLSILDQEYKDKKNFHLIHANILNLTNERISELCNGNSYKIIANIPYNITGKIFRKFLTENPKPTSLTLMIQKEVAKRIMADSGDMSLISLLCQTYADIELITHVGRNLFYPAPEVDSSVVKLTLVDKHLFKNESHEEVFWEIARVGFGNKRKQLASNLANFYDKNKDEFIEILTRAGFDPMIRAQELAVIDWAILAEEIGKCSNNRA